MSQPNGHCLGQNIVKKCAEMDADTTPQARKYGPKARAEGADEPAKRSLFGANSAKSALKWRDHLGIIWGIIWGSSGGHSGVILPSFGHRLGIIWRSFGHHLGVIWGSFGDHLGIMWRSSGTNLHLHARGGREAGPRCKWKVTCIRG